MAELDLDCSFWIQFWSLISSPLPLTSHSFLTWAWTICSPFPLVIYFCGPAHPCQNLKCAMRIHKHGNSFPESLAYQDH